MAKAYKDMFQRKLEKLEKYMDNNIYLLVISEGEGISPCANLT